MSKLKRMQRKRADQKKANMRLMSLHGGMREAPGSGKLLKRMTRDHQDLLQDIEFVFISRYREDRHIDDRIVANALKTAIQGDTSENALTESLNKELEEVRLLRSDVSDDIWRDGLLTVLQSVRRHSNLRPGERGYINFVSYFIL